METGQKFETLVEIMNRLRSPEGCPWDREQTHESLRQYLLEETYEVLEALDDRDATALKAELGDLLLQIVFHAQIAAEAEKFDISAIIEAITKKLIDRHPNVFGDLEIRNAREQSINWEKLKKAEGKESVLDGVPKALSALLRAHRIQQKASTIGFDWPDKSPVWDKVEEELMELREACRDAKQEAIEEELGDLLFALVNLSRFLEVNPEDALRKTTAKFIRRFQKIEKKIESQDREMSEASLEELDREWNRIKQQERRDPD